MKKTFCLLLVVFSRLIFSQTELKTLINIKIDTFSVKEYNPFLKSLGKYILNLVMAIML